MGSGTSASRPSSARQNKRRQRSVDAVTESITVEREIGIAATPGTVWDLLTQEEEAVKWMGKSASFDLRPGGPYRVEVIPGNTARGGSSRSTRLAASSLRGAGSQAASRPSQ